MTAIQIDLDKLVFGAEEGMTFGEAVVGAAARMLVNESPDLRRAIEQKAQEIIGDELRGRIEPMIAEALTAAIQPTSPWGEPKGVPTTLREYIVAFVRRWLNEPDPDHRRADVRKTRIEGFVAKEVESAVNAELRSALNEAKEEVAGAVKDQAATVLAAAITSMAAQR